MVKRFRKIAVFHVNDHKKLTTIKESLCKNIDAYFTCMTDKGIPADNNKAERSLRHLVLKRKISFGSRTQKGADTLSVLCSVLPSLLVEETAELLSGIPCVETGVRGYRYEGTVFGFIL